MDKKTFDVLHIRDAVSKTITVHGSIITLETDFTAEPIVIPTSEIETIERLFEKSYNRADEFKETPRGVYLNVSGGVYDDIGELAQQLLEKYQ